MFSLNLLINIKLSLAEKLLAYSAKGADEILGKILEFCAGSDSVFGVAKRLIVFPSASLTYVFFHNLYLLLNYLFDL